MQRKCSSRKLDSGRGGGNEIGEYGDSGSVTCRPCSLAFEVRAPFASPYLPMRVQVLFVLGLLSAASRGCYDLYD